MHPSPIPGRRPSVFIAEEHHEAFYIWRYALSRGLIQKGPHTLLHIDEHSDMGAPILHRSIHTLNGDIREVRNFTYNELGIATFIIPAIYEGLFDKVYWIKQSHGKTNRAGHNMYVRSQDDNGTLLATGRQSQLERFDDGSKTKSRNARYYKFYRQHMSQVGRLGKVVLDIDLDYFSCIQNPLHRELRIEITRDEHDGFQANPYHRIRFYDFGRVDVLSDTGRYYYCLNAISDPRPSPLKVDEAIIERRIRETVDGLRANDIKPAIITICRSRVSGYTPPDQWEFIEKQLLSSLGEIYDLEQTIHIGDIV